MDVKEKLDRLTPETERLPHWDAVLRDARPSRARWAAPRLAVVGAVLGLAALLAVAPWREAERAGVLEKALAAVGDGPVSHLVLRTEWGGTLVNLETGDREPLYGEQELWIDPERGLLRINRFGGVVQHRSVARPDEIEAPYEVLVSGYPEALESGRARLVGQGMIEGIPVHWIQVRRELLPDVGDGKVHEWAIQVAVSRDDYQPVYVRETRDGKPAELTGSRILVAERLPAGSGNFDAPSARAPEGPAVMYGVSPDPISRQEALQILDGRTAWLGEEFSGLRLAKIGRLTMKSGYSSDTGRWADEVTGVSIVYAQLTEQGEPDVLRPSITIQQAPRSHIALERGIGKYRVPQGHVAITTGGQAHLYFDGTYVAIWTPHGRKSEEVALAAARALRPLSDGSGAGE